MNRRGLFGMLAAALVTPFVEPSLNRHQVKATVDKQSGVTWSLPAGSVVTWSVMIQPDGAGHLIAIIRHNG